MTMAIVFVGAGIRVGESRMRFHRDSAEMRYAPACWEIHVITDEASVVNERVWM